MDIKKDLWFFVMQAALIVFLIGEWLIEPGSKSLATQVGLVFGFAGIGLFVFGVVLFFVGKRL